ncbi:MAG: YceI family protein [Acidimicrobiales bacterium]
MSRAKKIAIGAAAAIVLIVAAALFYLFVIREDAPPELELGETRSTEAGDDATTTAAPASTAGPDTTITPAEGIDGAWTIDPLSVAGYRVVEDFRGIPDFEAVGRTTTPIVGSLTIDGTTITEATFEVDVAGIESPESLRDGQFRDVMATDEFPTATFVLTTPIDLGSTPDDAVPVVVSATGDLTLKGTTLAVTFDITAQLNGNKIETLSQIPVVFSEYGIDTPSAPGITVEDNGLLEASIIFERP